MALEPQSYNAMNAFAQGSQLAQSQMAGVRDNERFRNEQAMQAISLIGSIALGAKGGKLDGPVDPQMFEQGLDFLQSRGLNVSAYRGRPEVADIAARASMTALQQIQGGLAAQQALLNMQSTLTSIQQRQQAIELQRQQIERSGIPAGFERDPATPGRLRPIAGGPQDPALQAQQAAATRRPDERSSDFDKATDQADAKRVGEMQTEAVAAQTTLDRVEQLRTLRRQALTGRVIGPAASAAGNTPLASLVPGSREAASIDGLAGAITLQLAESMKGALSDKDLAFLRQQVPGSNVSNDVAEVMHQALEMAARRKIDMASFYRAWAEKNGNVRGADEAWRKYINENQIFTDDRAAPGGFRIVPPKDWRPYIREMPRPQRGAQAASGGQTAPQQPETSASPATPRARGPDGRIYVVRDGQWVPE
jgi:hypothetical protein